MTRLAAVALLAVGCAVGPDQLQPFPCAADGSCPDQFQFIKNVGCVQAGTCTIKDPSCPSAVPKCAMVYRADIGDSAICLPLTGTLQEGAACTRVASGNDGYGRDNCDKGLYCLDEVANKQPTCRRLCTADADCASPLRCYFQLFATSQTVGVCVPTCTLFGSDCDVGFECHLTTGADRATDWHTYCGGVGVSPAGASCYGGTCTPGYACAPQSPTSYVCTQLCDATHPCANGNRCKPLPDVSNGGSLCF
jgi:hypothetical protein